MSNQSVQISLRNEKLLTLAQAAKAIPAINGKRPHASTLWRWARKGIKGVKLEYIRLGRRIVTSAAALDRFAESLALSDAMETSVSTSPTPANVKPHLLATNELEQSGFKVTEEERP